MLSKFKCARSQYSSDNADLTPHCLPIIEREKQGERLTKTIFNKSNFLNKSFGLLLLFISAQLLVFKPLATKAQEKQPARIENICPAQLAGKIDAIANRPQFSRSRWGILIQTLAPNNTLYSRDANQFFIPASNVKLLTTAAALKHLGSQFRIRTSVYNNGDGSLRVAGRGDPSLTDAQLKNLALQLRRSQITQVRQLIADDNYFQGAALNPTWEHEDTYFYYGTQINSLILNQNAIALKLLPQGVGQPIKVSWDDPIAYSQWQVENEALTSAAAQASGVEVTGTLGKPVLRVRGVLPVDGKPQTEAIAVLDPAQYFLQNFRRALIIQGITVAQTLVASNPQSSTEEVAFVESPTLADLVMETNQNSNNLYAEALLRTIGVAKQDLAGKEQNSAQQGLAIVKQTLTELGVNPESYVIADGSGLSRRNLVSPETLVQTLKAMAQTKEASLYKASLPVGGVSGTLKNRFRDTPAQGIVHAKTGTMTGVSSIAGYIDAPGYQPLVFTIIVNQSDKSVATVRQAMDEMVVMLTRLRPC